MMIADRFTKKALTVAGSDPTGGAGVQADLKVFHKIGVFGLSAFAALTAQNTSGVNAIMPIRASFLKKQLHILLADIIPDAVKTGMLYSQENVDTVANVILKFSLKNVVIDPVLSSSTGKRLSEKGILDKMIKRLLPYCTFITPNLYEASVMTGIDIKNILDMKKAAELLKGMGAENVIITGGHLEDSAIDVFYNGSFHFLKSRKEDGEFHGTGCTFSAALTAFLALGNDALTAAKLAKRFMKKAFIQTVHTGGKLQLFRF